MTRVCRVLYSVYLIMLDDEGTGFIESELWDTTTPLLRKCSKVRVAPTIYFCRYNKANECLTTLLLTVFTQNTL